MGPLHDGKHELNITIESLSNNDDGYENVT